MSRLKQGGTVLIGPVLPYRGGIAQHTTMLSREMRKRAGERENFTISFSRQYPMWLFPGETDKDPAYAGHQEPDVDYHIDSLNPFSWHKVVRRILKSDVSRVVFPWWSIYWAPCFFYIAWCLKHKGIEHVFICHNVVEHETAAWKRHLTRQILMQGSLYVVHTQEDKSNLLSMLPKAKIAVHPHPIYDQFPAAKGELPKRKSLELLFYGFVRPYKGVDILVEAMGLLKGEDVFLTIAGEFWQGEQELRDRVRELGLDEQVEIKARYHSDTETAELFDRADYLVLPYRSATGSGVIPVAYHYNRPVIVTRVGGLLDVVNENETGFLIEPENTQALAAAIRSASRERAALMLPAIQAIKKTMSWSSMVDAILDESNRKSV